MANLIGGEIDGYVVQRDGAWLSVDDLRTAGFKAVGRGCRVSAGIEAYGIERISLGDNVRIDTGALLLAGGAGAAIEIDAHVHIAARAILSGGGGIHLGKFTTVGFMSKLISASDSFSGQWLIGPQYAEGYTKVTRDPILLEDHAIVTTDCTLLPGAHMLTGAVLGACSLLRKGRTEEWGIYGGVPAKLLRKRMTLAIDLGSQWEMHWSARP